MIIRKAAVIGAGTMGSGIAAHLANAGVEVVLLDIVPGDVAVEDRAERNRLANAALKGLTRARPAAFMVPEVAQLIETGNVEDDIDCLRDCDWIIEAVTENLAVKRSLYERIARVRGAEAIVSSNTSGLSLESLTEGFDEGFCKHFLNTHFFNPPRHMYLLEVIPGPRTLPGVLATIEQFADLRLGKGVVRCKDTPNFIANRIGVFSMAAACHLLEEVGLSVEEADAVSGPPMGRPKTGTFRLHDLVGIDVAMAVMANTRELLPDDEQRDRFQPTAFLSRLLEEGRLGQKTGQGFYRKEGREILVLDLETFEYRKPRPVEFGSLQAVRRQRTTAERLRALVEADDRAAHYAWRLLSETLVYASNRVPEISDDLVSIDRAMRWGFNWELGPFEAWDAIGVHASVERLKREGRAVPSLVERLLASGRESFYESVESPTASSAAKNGAEEASGRVVFDLATSKHVDVAARPGILELDTLRRRTAPVRTCEGASLWDAGDGVLVLEFRSKMNTITGEMLAFISGAVDLVEAEDHAGLVVGNQAPHFSVGANLVAMSAAAQDKNWPVIEDMIRQFQSTVLRMRYCAKPVVVAVQGMALGGGCELALAGCRVQAAAETYIGLVELGVGLIPAGGGTREMACRAAEEGADVFPRIAAAFDNIAQARTSGSAAEARTLGYLRPVDSVSMNRDRAIADAKATVLYLAGQGYRPLPQRSHVRVAGRPGIAELKVRARQFEAGGFVSEYDAYLAAKFAYVLCGGDVDEECTVTEQYLLDLEREVFMSLVGEAKTLERISHTLKTGKPLRN